MIISLPMLLRGEIGLLSRKKINLQAPTGAFFLGFFSTVKVVLKF